MDVFVISGHFLGSPRVTLKKQLHKTRLPRASHSCYFALFLKGVQTFSQTPLVGIPTKG